MLDSANPIQQLPLIHLPNPKKFFKEIPDAPSPAIYYQIEEALKDELDQLNYWLIVDLFAGGGGASTGIEMALGRSPDIAINHDPEALAMHLVNHPRTLHLCQNVLAVQPLHATGGRRVDVLWASPDCTYFSKARGSKPRLQYIRDLPWIVIKWVEDTKPRFVFVENVEEFQEWGPLDSSGQPIKSQSGTTFKQWVRRLRRLGYSVDWKELRACDYGAPTSRKRLFIIARRDGKKVRWPEASHGPGTGQPWKSASECIDWNDRAPSIFNRKKPLAKNTQRRIAEGIRRYLLNSEKPFLVGYGATPGGTCVDILNPHIVMPNHAGEQFRGQSVEHPLSTVTQKGSNALVTSHLISIDHKGSEGSFSSTARSMNSPLTTITTENRHALVNANLAETDACHGHVDPYVGDGPSSAYMAKLHGTSTVNRVDSPLDTISAQGTHHALVQAPLIVKNYTGVVGHRVGKPLGTVTTWDHHSLYTAHLQQYNGCSGPQPLEEPMPTVTTKDRLGLTQAPLCQFNGKSECQPLDEPTPTILQENKLALVQTELNQDRGHYFFVRDFLRRFNVIGMDDEAVVTIQGVTYYIQDIGLRMLRPRELFRAHGFPNHYVIDPIYNGKPLTIIPGT